MGKKGKSKYENKFSIGDTFGDLTVTSENLQLGGDAKVKVICSCGIEKYVIAKHLLIGRISSCGCKNHKSGTEHYSWVGGDTTFTMTRYNRLKRCSKYNFNIEYDEIIRILKLQDYKCKISNIDLTSDIHLISNTSYTCVN